MEEVKTLGSEVLKWRRFEEEEKVRGDGDGKG